MDIKDLESLTRAALEQAQEDLWTLRTDAKLWNSRIGQMPPHGESRASGLLRSVFDRIDTYYSLHRHLHAFEERGWFEAQHGEVESVESKAFDHLVLVHSGFRCLVDEKIAVMQNVLWSPPKRSSKTLSRLYEKLKEDDPALRLLGWPAVLRTFSRELREAEFWKKTPLALEQTLFDATVGSIGSETSSGFYAHFSTPVHRQESFLGAQEVQWAKRERPWTLVIEPTLCALVKSRSLETLDSFVSNDSSTLQLRHVRFWNIVDRHMDEVQDPYRIAETVRAHGPRVTALLVEENTSLASHRWTDVLPEPTMTQKRTSKRRHRPHASATGEAVSTSVFSGRIRSRSVVIVTDLKHKKYWMNLRVGNGPKHWRDLEGAMASLWFAKFVGPGSIRTFKIVDEQKRTQAKEEGRRLHYNFHEPYEEKISQLQAKKEWLDRIDEDYEVILE